MYDIRRIAIEPTAKMKVRDASGEIVKDEKGNELTITFYGPGSKEFVRAQAELMAQVRAEMQAEQEAKEEAARKGQVYAPAVDEEQSTKRRADFLAKITASLDGFTYPGGPAAMYADITLGHLADDGDKFVGKRGNFKKSLPAGSSNSSDTQPG